MSDLVHQVTVDHSERRSALLDAVRRTGAFQVRMARLTTGDYLIGNDVLIEGKSVADFAASLVDGRLFPQVARLAHSGYRSLLLIEGSATTSIPDVHPHSLEGALVSIAAMWRVPVLHSSDVAQSARMLHFLADRKSELLPGLARQATAREGTPHGITFVLRPTPCLRSPRSSTPSVAVAGSCSSTSRLRRTMAPSR